MLRAGLLLVVPLLLACTPREETPMADTTVAADAAPLNYAGTWTVNVMPEAQDTVLLSYELVTTNEPTGWSLTLPGREPEMPRIISMNSDSVVVKNGPYPSAFRPNVMVTTYSTIWLEGDRLMGRGVARYETTDPDSVMVFRTVGTRR
jgi:hypothetical protein